MYNPENYKKREKNYSREIHNNEVLYRSQKEKSIKLEKKKLQEKLADSISMDESKPLPPPVIYAPKLPRSSPKDPLPRHNAPKSPEKLKSPIKDISRKKKTDIKLSVAIPPIKGNVHSTK